MLRLRSGLYRQGKLRRYGQRVASSKDVCFYVYFWSILLNIKTLYASKDTYHLKLLFYTANSIDTLNFVRGAEWMILKCLRSLWSIVDHVFLTLYVQWHKLWPNIVGHPNEMFSVIELYNTLVYTVKYFRRDWWLLLQLV